jgi:hypothetical protein
MTITSCTEDEVKPTEEGTEGGHDEGDPINWLTFFLTELTIYEI